MSVKNIEKAIRLKPLLFLYFINSGQKSGACSTPALTFPGLSSRGESNRNTPGLQPDLLLFTISDNTKY
jgi:hypothetical protein